MSEPSALTASSTIAIIGGGQAGAEAATLLRQFGYPGRIKLFGSEPYLPYMRPPLSKAFLAGETPLDSLFYKAPAAYEKSQIEILTGIEVTAIDRHAKVLKLDQGEDCAYDRLILATGGRARPLPVPGADLGNIYYLRSIKDVLALQPQLQAGKKLAIVGGGYVGLEVAAVAIKHGLSVTVIEGAPRLLARVAAPELSAFYEMAHRAEGVEIRTGLAVSGFTPSADGKTAIAVECGEEASIAADFFIIGIGLIPNTELAAHAGLVLDGGILVDERCLTNDPHIYAIGDCSIHAHHGFLQRKIRLESVPNALEQARTAASGICGQPLPEATAPWFWSDQYDLQLQIVGISEGYDQIVIRGEPEKRAFTTFYLHEGHVIAADAINRPRDFLVAKRFIGARRKIEPETLRDESVQLKTLL